MSRTSVEGGTDERRDRSPDWLPNRVTDRLPDPVVAQLQDRPFDAERTRLGAAGAVSAGVALVWLGGLPGVVAATVLALAWFLLPATFAFAVGQVGVVAFAPGGGLLGTPGALAGVAVAEVGLFGLLLAPAVELAEPGQAIPVAVGWAVVGGAFAWAGAASPSTSTPWLAGLALVALTALAAYALHRYQLVSLGLVDENRTGEATGEDATGGEPR